MEVREAPEAITVETGAYRLEVWTGQPMARLLEVVPDPVAALRTADQPSLDALAALELRSAGVRARTP